MTGLPLSLAVAAFVALLVAVVLGLLTLIRVGALARERDSSTRDAAALRVHFEAFVRSVADHERDVRSDLAAARDEYAVTGTRLREELAAALARQQQGLAQQQQGMAQQLSAMGGQQQDQLKAIGERIGQLTQSSEARLEALRKTIEERLDLLRQENAHKLDQMRATVDEKLQTTLEQRLGASFKHVSERLELVHRGLGEMQTLAAGVGDLKRVLTNVKSRGTWGEVQLGALLGDLLTPAQYAQNIATRPGSDERVEFAVRLPGSSDDGTPCWLPIDAKFPLDDWQRLQDAIERADPAAVDESRRALDQFFKKQAKMIRDKYVEPPHTTDFAILFVPTEGLFAEACARPGLTDTLQRDFRVTLVGPANLAAMLNSLQLGFRTLAIEKRSTEVWRVLGAVKTEFGRFGDILAKTKDKLDQVGKTLDEAGRKSTTIARKLRDVEALPEGESDRLLTGDSGRVIDVDDDADVPALDPPAGP
ncbi:MAG: DNA recombination protein RmuC [Betaproteobacteria bacterium]|nr:DNA recombination protein RmuC [Betaproteobacteria bacterium]